MTQMLYHYITHEGISSWWLSWYGALERASKLFIILS